MRVLCRKVNTTTDAQKLAFAVGGIRGEGVRGRTANRRKKAETHAVRVAVCKVVEVGVWGGFEPVSGA